jgi:hypothetical protein
VVPVALVEGQPIDVRRFLARMWTADSLGSKEVLDQLVVSQIALRRPSAGHPASRPRRSTRACSARSTRSKRA